MGGAGGARDHATIGLVLLCFAAGTMDATAFLALGQVFTSAMSGNTILLGLAVGQGNVGAALHNLAALLGYGAGVALAAVPLARPARGIGQALALEALFLAGFTALWLGAGMPLGTTATYFLIILSAVAMGLQGAVGRVLNVPGIMTVIFTSTYTAIIGTFAERALRRERPLLTGMARRQLLVFGVYLGSAILAGVIVPHWFGVMPFLPLAAVLVLLAGMVAGRLRLAPRPA